MAPASRVTTRLTEPREGRRSRCSPSRRRNATEPTGSSRRQTSRAPPRPTPRRESRAPTPVVPARTAARRTTDSPMAPRDESSDQTDTRPLPEGPAPNVLQELPPLLKVLGQVVAPATLITALLIFFGWSRTTALFGWFGIDPTSLGFSSTDYLLTSQD